MNIYLDIETIPTQRNDARTRIYDAALEKATTAEPPSNYKKDDAIRDWRKRRIDAAVKDGEEAWHKTSLDGSYGELCCICWAFDDGPINVSSRASVAESERDLLGRFFASLANAGKRWPSSLPHWIGYNLGFDLRFIHHRAVVLQVKPPFFLPYNMPAWGNALTDLMYEWCGARGYMKLSELCDALGIVVEDDIDGSQVWETFQDNNIEKIESHCAADVERVRLIDRRFRWENDHD